MNKTFTFRGTAEDVEALKKEAQKYLMTPSQYIRMLLLNHGVIK